MIKRNLYSPAVALMLYTFYGLKASTEMLSKSVVPELSIPDLATSKAWSTLNSKAIQALKGIQRPQTEPCISCENIIQPNVKPIAINQSAEGRTVRAALAEPIASSILPAAFSSINQSSFMPILDALLLTGVGAANAYLSSQGITNSAAATSSNPGLPATTSAVGEASSAHNVFSYPTTAIKAPVLQPYTQAMLPSAPGISVVGFSAPQKPTHVMITPPTQPTTYMTPSSMAASMHYGPQILQFPSNYANGPISASRYQAPLTIFAYPDDSLQEQAMRPVPISSYSPHQLPMPIGLTAPTYALPQTVTVLQDGYRIIPTFRTMAAKP